MTSKLRPGAKARLSGNPLLTGEPEPAVDSRIRRASLAERAMHLRRKPLRNRNSSERGTERTEKLNTAETAELWLARKTLVSSPHTVRTYRWAISYLPDRIPPDPDLLDEMLAGIDMATQSKIDLYRVWTNFFNWLERRMGADEYGQSYYPNPMVHVERPKERGKKFPRVFSDEEVADLWNACQSRQERAMIAVLLDSGVRIDELRSMEWRFIFAHSMKIEGKTGERTVPISKRARAIIEGLGDKSHVWTGRRGPFQVGTLKHKFRAICDRAGLTGPKLGPHTMRHTFATNWIRKGGSVFTLQKVLGHSTINTTMIYVHMVGEDMARDHEAVSSLSIIPEVPDELEWGEGVSA